MRFHAGSLPEGYKFSFEPTLFNLHEHLLLQSADGWRSFYALDDKSREVQALMYVHVADGHASSPLKSPYGSVEGALDQDAETLFYFLDFVEDQLKKEQVATLLVKSAPQCYEPELHTKLYIYLANRAYRIKDAEVGAAIRVDHSVFESGLGHWGREKIRKLESSSLNFKQLDVDELNGVFTFIEECHLRKGYTLSMPYEHLSRTVLAFPDRYYLFGVFEADTLASACIAIRVSSNILYYFYADHHPDFDSLSPSVELIRGLYKFCQGESIQLLDLGTAALDGVPNFGLLNFKLRLGAQSYPKFTFYKEL